MLKNNDKTTGIACGIFKNEIDALIKEGKLDHSFTYLDSMLHMAPARLKTEMEKHTDNLQDGQAILVYGDCQPSMSQMNEKKNVCKVSGMNCCEIILGKEKYKTLRSQGAFFLLPEWTIRWEEVFKKKLGFNRKNARTFMQDMHTKLIYLDTGVSPIPEKALADASEFCDLPLEILKVDLDPLLKVILDAKKTLNNALNF